MSSNDASIMLVRAGTLHTHPQAFQEYVNQYFELKDIGGIEYYVAFLTLGLSNVPYQSPIGVARRHSCDVNIFKGELPDGQRLSDWISTQLQDTRQKDIIRISKYWDDGCVGSFSED